MVGMARELAEHKAGFVHVLGFAKHLAVNAHYGVGRDDQFVVRQTAAISLGLFTG